MDINEPLSFSLKMRFQVHVLARLAKWVDRRHGNDLFFVMTNASLGPSRRHRFFRAQETIEKGLFLVFVHGLVMTFVTISANREVL